METTPNHRTMAEYFIRGLTEGFVTAAQVIAWSDEIIAVAPKTEDWMVEISSSSPEDRMGVLHQLHEVKGEVDAAALEKLLAGK